MSSKLIKFSRSFWETAVAYGGSNERVLRDYDIIKERQSGKTIGQLEVKYNLSRQQICNILNKYK